MISEKSRADAKISARREFTAVVSKFRAYLKDQLRARTGILYTDYEAMLALSEAAEATLRMNALAKECNSSRSNLSHVADRLEKKGWVTRDWARPDDRRGSFATLTAEGFRALETAVDAEAQAVDDVLPDRLDPRLVTALGEISGVISERLERRMR
jgi:DNA-binding MarR family transcriptional regulator